MPDQSGGRGPDGHPLRAIKQIADEAVLSINDDLESMYAESGCPSIPPERSLKSMLLMALYSVRSDVQLCEQIQYKFCSAGSWTAATLTFTALNILRIVNLSPPSPA